MQNEELRSYDFIYVGGYNNLYKFETAHNIEYDVRFKPSADYVPPVEAWRDDFYEIVIEIASAPDRNRIPADSVIFPTIIAVITAFFAIDERVILYICDDSDSRELARKRKFDNWYRRFGSEHYQKHDLPTVTAGAEHFFAAVFFRRDNPHRYAILDAFRRLGAAQK